MKFSTCLRTTERSNLVLAALALDSAKKKGKPEFFLKGRSRAVKMNKLWGGSSGEELKRYSCSVRGRNKKRHVCFDGSQQEEEQYVCCSTSVLFLFYFCCTRLALKLPNACFASFFHFPLPKHFRPGFASPVGVCCFRGGVLARVVRYGEGFVRGFMGC